MPVVCLRSGFLQKKGRAGGWKDRRFVLTQDELRYFAVDKKTNNSNNGVSTSMPTGDAKGELPLLTIEKIEHRVSVNI